MLAGFGEASGRICFSSIDINRNSAALVSQFRGFQKIVIA
jgi:hypothetical protein